MDEEVRIVISINESSCSWQFIFDLYVRYIKFDEPALEPSSTPILARRPLQACSSRRRHRRYPLRSEHGTHKASKVIEFDTHVRPVELFVFRTSRTRGEFRRCAHAGDKLPLPFIGIGILLIAPMANITEPVSR